MTIEISTCEDQVQAVRVYEQGQSASPPISTSEIVYLTCYTDEVSGKVIVLWDDILAAFSNVVHVRHGARILPFVKGNDFKRLDPLRIAAIPDAIFDVVVSPHSALNLVPTQHDDPNSKTIEQPLSAEPSQKTESNSSHYDHILTSGVIIAKASIFNEPAENMTDIISSASNLPDGLSRRGPQAVVERQLSINKLQPRMPQELITQAIEDVTEPMYSAKRGDKDAQIELGNKYKDGKDVEQDYQAAMDWYRLAADQEDPDGQYKVGYMYYHGHSVVKDYSTSREWYLKAAEQGHIAAICDLGRMYELGLDTPVDFELAMDFYRRSAKKGYAEAEYNIGNMYRFGKGVAQDDAEAMAWFLKAAEKGNANAQASIGFMYQRGHHVPQDFSLSIAWYHKAAAQNSMMAQFNLGYMYEHGEGVPMDYVRAKEWYQMSADQGEPNAKKNLDSLEKLDKEPKKRQGLLQMIFK
ncbi:hypothetical protein FBU30_008922 [Linnemannia zychae]|nr:hypothetical protein FBU30_008922 [Linnemannia zychae]